MRVSPPWSQCFLRALRAGGVQPAFTAEFLRRDEGAVALLYALAIPVVMGFAWLALNYSVASAQHSYIQAAADSGALAGAGQFSLSNVSTATIQHAATAAARANLTNASYNAAPDDVTASVDTKHSAVSVTVTRHVNIVLCNNFGLSASTISASATSTFHATPICVLVLDPSANAAFNAFGNSNITAPGCAIISDSTSTTGLPAKTSGLVQSQKACSSGGWTGTAFSPTPISDCPAIADPLASRTPPPNAGAACNYTNYQVDSSNDSAPLTPGVYCGGLTIKAAANFSAGDYIIRGGSLTISAGGSMLGSNVGFYFTGGASLDGQPNSGISLTAPSNSTDPMVGLVFWEDPNNSSSGPITHTIKSDNAQNLAGTVYFPQGTLIVGGNAKVGTSADYTIIVARDFETFQSANVVLNTNYSGSTIPVPAGVIKTGVSLAK